LREPPERPQLCAQRCSTPSGLGHPAAPGPRVALRLPWAVLFNPFGVIHRPSRGTGGQFMQNAHESIVIRADSCANCTNL
jgi:hypothetical protein